jgi:hypothetical protein
MTRYTQETIWGVVVLAVVGLKIAIVADGADPVMTMEEVVS